MSEKSFISWMAGLCDGSPRLRLGSRNSRAKLGLPPKTPDNSSVPRSKGQKASEPSKPRPKANPQAGEHRPLHPNPTRERIVSDNVCQDCGADVSNVAQSAVQVYDRIEIPKVEPDVTRVTLRGGVCPCCARRFKALAPEGLEPGSPFEPNLRALVIYLRSVQGIPMARLSDVLKDLFDLDISEGALVSILEAARRPFAAQTNLIKQRLLSATALEYDENRMRVSKANWWLWVFHHGDSAAFVAEASRYKAVVEKLLGELEAGRLAIGKVERGSKRHYGSPWSHELVRQKRIKVLSEEQRSRRSADAA